MSETMGYSGLFVRTVLWRLRRTLRFFSPPFGEYIAQTQKREGTLAARTALDSTRRGGGVPRRKREGEANSQQIVARKTTWSHFYFYSQFKQGIVDQYALKYFILRSVTWCSSFIHVLSFPAQIAARYKENNTLIQSSCESVGDLLMVYKKLSASPGSPPLATGAYRGRTFAASQPSNANHGRGRRHTL